MTLARENRVPIAALSLLLLELLVVLVVAACAGRSVSQGLLVSGNALDGIGQQFVIASKAFATGCHATPPTIPPKACASFRDFQGKFQQSYPLAVQAWKTARKGNDVGAAQGAEATIAALGIELATLTAGAIGAVGGK